MQLLIRNYILKSQVEVAITYKSYTTYSLFEYQFRDYLNRTSQPGLLQLRKNIWKHSMQDLSSSLNTNFSNFLAEILHQFLHTGKTNGGLCSRRDVRLFISYLETRHLTTIWKLYFISHRAEHIIVNDEGEYSITLYGKERCIFLTTEKFCSNSKAHLHLTLLS